MKFSVCPVTEAELESTVSSLLRACSHSACLCVHVHGCPLTHTRTYKHTSPSSAGPHQGVCSRLCPVY